MTIARTVRPVHFEDFSGAEFERLVFAYHLCDGWIDTLAQTGSDLSVHLGFSSVTKAISIAGPARAEIRRSLDPSTMRSSMSGKRRQCSIRVARKLPAESDA